MVDTNAALPSLADLLSSNSVPALSFKDAKVGDSFTGIITDAESAQVKDYESGKPKFWDDGNPQMQIILTLATDYRDAQREEDDGERKAYLPGEKLKALKQALKEAGQTTVNKGDVFTITYIGTKPSTNKKYNDVKLYGIKIEAGKSNPSVDKLLAEQGAKPVAAASDKVDPEIVDKVKKLKASNFDPSEIADMAKISIDAVNAILDETF